MKKFIFIIVFLITILLSTFTVYADTEDATEYTTENIYNSQYEQSGADALVQELTPEVKKQLKDIGITSPSWQELNSMSFFDIFGSIMNTIQQQSVTPLNCVVKIMGVVMLVALINSVKSSLGSSSLTAVLNSVATLTVSIILIQPVCQTIEYSTTIIKLSADFMLVFIPVMAGIMLTMGQSLQAAGSYTMVMGAGTAVSQISNNILVPLLNTFLGISVVSGISQRVNLNGFCELVNKVLKWVLTFTMSVFTAILTMQSIISSSADSAGVKATRFAISSFVPLVGGALSEAYQTVRGCMGMLKSGVGVFAILATGTIYLPAIISCVLWLVAINIAIALAGVFDMGDIIKLLKSVTTVINSLIAILLCCMIIFIVSSAIMLMVGGVS
ncbi:stage III sporulation protein AE [Oscillospiraceae bacterium LCP25S3_E10]|nr:stage III sporulation protein AE [Ruminococcus sp.]MDY2855833.1 stage III sporulation protein AE [Oscillospiraceae bacterium]